MDPLSAEQIVMELKEKRLYDADDISQFLQSKVELDRNCKIELFKAMTREFLYDWNYVQYHIMEVFDNDEMFLNLVLFLAEKNYHESIRRLVGAYAIDIQKTMSLYENLLNSSSPHAAGPLTCLLLGIGKIDPPKFYGLIDLSASSSAAKAAYLEALRIRSLDSEIPDEFMPPIIKLTDSSDEWVRRVAVHFLLTSRTNQEAVRNKLRQMASTGRKEDKVKIGREGIIRQKWDAELALELVTLCSYSDDADVLNNLDMTMGSLAEDYPIECLEILKRWFRNPLLRNKVSAGWAPDQIGKKHAERVDEYLLAWVAEGKDELVLRFDLPRLIWDIFEKNDRMRLLQILEKLDRSTESGLTIFTETAEKALSESHGKPEVNTKFVDRCHQLVCDLAVSKGIETSKVRIDKDDKILLTLAILQEATTEKPNIDFDAALTNISGYPNIEQLVGRSWFERMVKEKDKTQPLIWLLSRARPEEEHLNRLYEEFQKHKENSSKLYWIMTAIRRKFEPHAVLEHIDRSIAIFKTDNQPRLKSIRDGLTNPDQLYQTTGELFIAAHLRASYPTEMQVKFGNKTADCKTVVEGKDIVIEVVNPDMSLELKYLRTVVTQSGNRTKSKIQEKLESQIPGIAKNTDAPIFLAVNRGRAGIDDLEIADALYGSMKIVMYFDQKTGTAIKTESAREADGISTVPSGRLISGIILYRTYFDHTDGKEKLEGEIFRNLSDRPVTDEIIEALKKALFKRALA
jgi:hypothetical protein